MDRVEAFLRTEVGNHPSDLVEHAAHQLRVPGAEVESVVQRLLQDGELEERMDAGKRMLAWKPVVRARVAPQLQEDRLWRESVAPRIRDVPDNVRRVLQYGTSEMVNNVIDHSRASAMAVVVRRLPEEVEIEVADDGIGIFEKLQKERGLEDPRHVALELAKGKLTTDPQAHTGEGIFFTSRMCDKFLIWSDTTVCGQVAHGPWHVQTAERRPGTTVRMVVRLDSRLTPESVFDEFAPPGEEHGFTRTAVQVDLVQQGGDHLVSRSQARRLLARCERFREITLDFRGIATIGPAFADEVFRVFPARNPGVTLRETNTSDQVRRMIGRARSAAGSPPDNAG